jgi:DNA-binding beta-propeller fold protein YncE
MRAALNSQLRSSRLYAALSISLGLGACEFSREQPLDARELAIQQFDTIVSAQTSDVGVVADLAVAPNGDVWIADRANSQLLVMRPDGSRLKAFAKRGSGPGELSRPEALALSDSMILVLDAGNARVQYFTFKGVPAGQFSLNTAVIVPVALNQRGDVAAMTLGHDSSLVRILHDNGHAHRRVGTPVAAPPTVMSLSSLKQQALRGEIPLEFQNNVLPILGGDGQSWLVLQARGDVQYFDANGRMMWNQALPDSVVSRAHQTYLAKASAGTDMRQIPVPQIVVAGRIHNGKLWLMLPPGSSGKNTIVVLDSRTGDVLQRIPVNLMGAGNFALDPSGNRIYIVVPDDGLIVAAQLSTGI